MRREEIGDFIIEDSLELGAITLKSVISKLDMPQI